MPFRLLVRSVCLAAATAILAAAIAAPAMAEEPLPAAELKRLIGQLSSARFVEREGAMLKLIEAGGVSIDPLMEHLPAAGPEGVARGVFVLSELALSSEAATSQRSWTAIEQLASRGNGVLSRRAADSLLTLHTVRMDRARDALVQSGARVTNRQGQIGGVFVAVVYLVEIPEDFKGDLDVIRQIKWLEDVRQVSMRGEQVTDDWLEPLAELSELVAVDLKHTKVTEAGVAHLKGLANLQYLSVYYSPVGDEAIETLRTMKSLAEIRLFGTKVTSLGATELQRALALANIDHRHGAFLGVGCAEHPEGAQITIMPDGSAADRAGMRSGDVIQEFNGKPVASFDELKAAIAEHPAGGEVVVKAIRGQQPLDFKVKLGEWE